MKRFVYVIVYSTSHAIRIERELQTRGLDCRLVPVPRQFSSDCGVCVRIADATVEVVRGIVESTQIEIEGIHSVG